MSSINHGKKEKLLPSGNQTWQRKIPCELRFIWENHMQYFSNLRILASGTVNPSKDIQVVGDPRRPTSPASADVLPLRFHSESNPLCLFRGLSPFFNSRMFMFFGLFHFFVAKTPCLKLDWAYLNKALKISRFIIIPFQMTISCLYHLIPHFQTHPYPVFTG